jgi:integrase
MGIQRLTLGKRRSNGEGSIFKDKTRGLWIAEIYTGGKKKRKASKSQQVVKTWLLAQREALRDGIFILNDKATYSEFLDRFMADIVVRTLKPKTVDSYQHIVENHIKPELGGMKLIDLRPDHLQALYSKKLDSGLSKRTVQYIHAVIRRSLNLAVKWGLIVRNPTDAVTAPIPPKRPPETLTIDQINSFFEVVKDHMYYPIYCLAIGCGLREGEILGLRKMDVSLTEGVLQVRQTIVTIRGCLSIGEPKSEASKRPVALPDFALESIRKPLSKVEADEKLIFTTSSGNRSLPETC